MRLNDYLFKHKSSENINENTKNCAKKEDIN